MSPDERAGIAWWNALSNVARVYWLERASAESGRKHAFDASPAEAWRSYKREQQNPRKG